MVTYLFYPSALGLSTSRAKVLECSAKDDINVTEIFKVLLSLSRIILPANNENTMGLKRRSSAYVSATSKGTRTTKERERERDVQYLIYRFALKISQHPLLLRVAEGGPILFEARVCGCLCDFAIPSNPPAVTIRL